MVTANVDQKLKPITERLAHLKLFQSLYLLALVLMLVFAIQGAFEKTKIVVVGLIALTALAIELWPKFVMIWETLLGRVIIILTYAVIGNFAVAFAARKLNEIVGIDPSPLFYSISFATLIMAPAWILTLTLFAMALYTIAIQIGVLLRVGLKYLRLIKNEQNGMRYPITTAFTRLILMPAMFTTLVSGIESYDGRSTINVVNKQGRQAEDSKELTEAVEPELLESTGEAKDAKSAEELPGALEQAAENDNEQEDENMNLDKLIAAFVHNVELFEYSQCIKAKNEHVIYIGESDILVSRPNPDSQFGYDFSVRSCTLKSY